MAKGSITMRVENLQKKLRKLGYLAEPVDGVFGSRTQEAVKLFLERKIPFLKIGELVKESLSHFKSSEVNTYSDVTDADKAAREFVLRRV